MEKEPEFDPNDLYAKLRFNSLGDMRKFFEYMRKEFPEGRSLYGPYVDGHPLDLKFPKLFLPKIRKSGVDFETLEDRT